LTGAVWAAGAPAGAGGGAPAAMDEGATREVDVGVELFGVGGVIRRGDWAAVRLTLRDRGDRVRGAVVRLHVADPDGDAAMYTRSIVLNPGRSLAVWMYPHLPFTVDGGSVFTVTVHAASGEGEDDDG